MISLLPQVHFPRHLYSGDRSMAYLQSLPKDATFFVIVSHNFFSKHPEVFEKYFPKEIMIFHQHGEPSLADYTRLQEKFTAGKYEYVVAIGGGATIDLGKLLKRDFTCTLIACPTTIASGSEVSRYSVLMENDQKKVYTSEDSLPDVVLLCPLLLSGLSKEQIVYQSFDVLAHALEALVSRASHSVSDSLAISATEHCAHSLGMLSDSEPTPSILAELQIASFFAGMAQSSVGTGLTHAIAHYLGGRYHITHTQLIARFLPAVVALNLSKTDKYAKLNQLSAITDTSIVAHLQEWYEQFGLNLESIQLTESIEETATGIKKDICMITNPYPASIEDISTLLGKYV